MALEKECLAQVAEEYLNLAVKRTEKEYLLNIVG